MTQDGSITGATTFDGFVNIEGQLLTDLVDERNVTKMDAAALLRYSTQTIYGKPSRNAFMLIIKQMFGKGIDWSKVPAIFA